MLNINADEWEPTFTCLGAAIPYMYECPGGEDDGGDRLELLSEFKTGVLDSPWIRIH
jgi:hypothetical protein